MYNNYNEGGVSPSKTSAANTMNVEPIAYKGSDRVSATGNTIGFYEIESVYSPVNMPRIEVA